MLNQYQWISLLHIVVIAPFLAYIAYKGYKDEEVSKTTYILLFLLAAWAFFYHIYKMVKYSQ